MRMTYPNLKLQIFRRGLRQNVLARELKIDAAFLSKIIHGYRDPSPIVRKRIAEYLAVDESWLFEKYPAEDSRQSVHTQPHSVEAGSASDT